ncbi:hypothetical protein DSM110277_03748 (plasmid) [Sulfitobacter pontiacus]|uniref:Glycosyl transferases group 1 n=1 Tax=Sulfitobacter pontiacus TaxID=60137 RepID=A0AAX3AGY0_9RHOB|nr:glycosyltransferase [Sulfitobacter pontiacus]UOA25294.1 hypothetical protein DSM110277_03748 [Sulfitobacter pontiacus]
MSTSETPSERLSVLGLTQGNSVPSARFRIRQHIPALSSQNIEVIEKPATFGAYPPAERSTRPFWLCATGAERLMAVLSSSMFDATILQRELISTLSSFEKHIKGPLILDVDDAIWMHRGGIAARHLARNADVICCGNDFIAEYFGQFCSSVHVIPTSVDTERFLPKTNNKLNQVVGWSGTSGGYRFFFPIIDAVVGVIRNNPGWRLRFVSDAAPPFLDKYSDVIDFLKWTPQTEVSAIQGFDIGLMPTDDSDWSRGKCSYKMLLYMACGLPVIVSKFGMNKTILGQGELGFGAIKPCEWASHLQTLIDDNSARVGMGAVGRNVCEQHYSSQSISAQLGSVVRSAITMNASRL